MAEPDVPQVLLVEDNPDHEELIRRAFAEREPRVALAVARHGEEALDYLHRRGEYQDPSRSPRPRLILLDLRLPRVDGLEVLRRDQVLADAALDAGRGAHHLATPSTTSRAPTPSTPTATW